MDGETKKKTRLGQCGLKIFRLRVYLRYALESVREKVRLTASDSGGFKNPFDLILPRRLFSDEDRDPESYIYRFIIQLNQLAFMCFKVA